MSSLEFLSHLRAFPEALLLLGTCVVMMVDVYSKDERRRAAYYGAQATLLLCFISTLFILYESEGTRQLIFNGLFVSDAMGHLLKLVCYLAVSAALVYSRQYLVDRNLLRGEFVTLLLFCLLGMMVLISAASFLTLFLGLELMSLCLYALVALNRDSALSTEAAMKYFVLGALSSGLLLYGMAMLLLVNGLPDLAQDWQQMLALLALLSMAIGNITAIAQSNLKRMLAYSTIAHMGFMLLGLLSGVVEGNRLNAADAYSSALFYMIVYVLMSLGAFGVLLYCSRAGFECENLEDMRGLNRTNPWYAFIMLVLMFSLAGIPPTAGFYAKLAVLSAAVNAGQIWLAVAAVVFSLIGAYYYLRVVKLMYFDEPKEMIAVSGGAGFRFALSANGLAMLLFGILPWLLMNPCLEAIKAL